MAFKKRPTVSLLLAMLFYASVFPWSARGACFSYYDQCVGDVTGDNTSVISGINSITGGGTSPSISGFAISHQDNSIANAALVDNTILTGKIANNTILSGDIADGTIASVDVADNTLTPAKLNALSGTPGGTTFYRGDGAWSQTSTYSIPGQSAGLIVKSVVDDQNVKIDADYVLLADGSLNLYQASSVNLTVSLDTSGANGLDAGSLAANTGYFLYVIYNGTTVAGLASTSATSPIMPSGYTYKARVSWATTDATTTPFNVEEFTQIDDVYLWTEKPVIVSAGGSTTTAAINLAAGGAKTWSVVPPAITKGVFGRVHAAAAFIFYANPVTFSNSVGWLNTETEFSTTGAGSAAPMSWILRALQESQTMYYQTSVNVTIILSGFTLFRRSL